MSTHSAIFGPTKYGMLPELLPEKKLSWGNGIFGLGTFSAIITGTIFAGTLSDTFGKKQIYSGVILIALALVGLSLCLRVARVPAADPQKKFRANFFGDFFSQMKIIRADRVLFLGVDRQRLSVVSRRAAAADDSFLRQGHFAFRRHAQRLAASRAGAGHRRRQFRGRIFVRRKN